MIATFIKWLFLAIAVFGIGVALLAGINDSLLMAIFLPLATAGLIDAVQGNRK